MKIENEESPFTNSCLFTLDRLPLLLLLYAETRSSAVQKRDSKVYGNPIAPSFYSISPWLHQNFWHCYKTKTHNRIKKTKFSVCILNLFSSINLISSTFWTQVIVKVHKNFFKAPPPAPKYLPKRGFFVDFLPDAL